MYSVKLNPVKFPSVMLPSKLLTNVWLSSAGIKTHFWRRFPMKSCRPIRAKTLRQNTVKIMTSASFLTDWMSAPTMVFSPDNESQRHMVMLQLKDTKPLNVTFEVWVQTHLKKRVDNLEWQWWSWELGGLWKFLTQTHYPSRQTLSGTWKADYSR